MEYGISRHEKCAEYMYVFTPSPRMIYGDEKGEVSIAPDGQRKFEVPRIKELTDLLNLKSYESCDADNRKPILMLMEVRCDDGSVWHPYARAF